MRPLAAQLHGSRDLGHGISLAVNPEASFPLNFPAATDGV